jgi:hypothetical protein
MVTSPSPYVFQRINVTTGAIFLAMKAVDIYALKVSFFWGETY